MTGEGLESVDESSIRKEIKRYLRGRMSGPVKLELEAFQRIHAMGEQAVPVVLKELKSFDLTKLNYYEGQTAVVGLASLLHDLDEEKSRSYLNEALSGDCDDVVSGAFNAILRYCSSKYRRSFFNDIEIYEENGISRGYRASRKVRKWLSWLPSEDLEGISRIYIVDAGRGYDFEGNMLPHLSVVTLAWETVMGWYNPLYFVFSMNHQATLYHEVGHHVCKHEEFGQVPEQEDEADEYARKHMRRAHPVLAFVVRMVWGSVLWTMRKIFRLFVKKAG